MKRRGLADGDDAALDQSVGAAREAAAARRFDDAIQHADDARLRAVAVVVDKGFVQQKLARVNTRYDATPPSGARDRATASLQRATDELRKGRLELANRALNDCLALLTGG